MKAELEGGLGAEAVDVSTATTKSSSLRKHVGSTCFLAEVSIQNVFLRVRRGSFVKSRASQDER
jgi:hypothetical protein